MNHPNTTLKERPNVEIHFARIGKPTRIFTDRLIEDDGVRLKTHAIIPAEHAHELSIKFQQQGLLGSKSFIFSVAKHLFYREYFGIMQFKNASGGVLGVYTDIATPLRKVGGQFHLTDLCLDIWISEDRKVSVLDRNEFEEACKEGLILPDLANTALLTLERLLAEEKIGTFPEKYVS